MPSLDRITVEYPQLIDRIVVEREDCEDVTITLTNPEPLVVAVSVAPGIEEAPSNGSQYARKDGAWAIVTTPTHSHELDELDATGITVDYVLTADGAGGAVWAELQAGGGAGTVTSVALTVPTGLSVSGSPITTSGTIAISLTTGYAIPTTTQLTKLDGIETGADVTDTANVTAAGALMDSELADLAGVKGVTISTLQPKPSEGAFANGDKTKLDGIAAGANNYTHPNHSGAVTSTGDGATALGSFTLSQLNTALSDADVATGGGTATGTNTGDQDLSSYLTSSTAASTYQPLDADLTAIAGLSSADGNFIVGSAGGWVTESGSTARSSLGLGSLATLSAVDPATVDLTASYTWSGSHTFPNLTGFAIWDYVGDHRLYFGTTEDLTASRTLYFDVSNANRTVTISGDATISGTNTGDQDLSGYLTTSTASSTYQPLDTQLTSLAGLTYASNSLKVVRVNAGETAFELATISAGGGDAVTSGTLDQFADVTQTGGATLAITSSTTLGGGNHSGTNTGDNAVNSLYSGLVSNATHTGDATGATALTLATVNSNVGSFGSATAVGTFTVNGKGLITAAGSTTITPAVGSITGLGTGVGAALAINVGSAGAPVLFNGAGGTPSSITLTNASGTAASLTAGTCTTIPNLSGDVTSSGNTTTIAAGAVDIAMLSATGAPSGTTYLRGDNTWATIAGGGDLLAANNLSDLANAATARTNLGLAIGTNVQAYDADLTTWAGITPGTGVGTFLATPSSANLLAAVTDETGTGSLVFATSPTLVTPALGTPSAIVLTNATGTASSLTAGTATAANGLNSATTTVAVSSATAPSSGQVLTATSSTAATWQTPAGGTTRTYKRLAANFATTSTTYVDVDNGSGDDWIFAVAANTDYEINVVGRKTSSGSTIGVEMGVNGPASPDSVVGYIEGTVTGITTNQTAYFEAYDADINFSSGPSSVAFSGFKMRILIQNGANSGNVAIRLRAEAAGTVTILAGAICDIQEITIS